MKHRITWEEDNGCVRFSPVDEIEPAHVIEIVSECRKLLEGREPRFVLIDHRESPQSLSRETRAEFEKHGPTLEWTKLGFYGLSPLTRMVARVIIGFIGGATTTKFFKTEAEVLAWFHADR